MKKILATILICMLIMAPMAVAAVPLVNENPNVSAGKAAVAPVIDGKLDADSYEKLVISAGDWNGDDGELADWLVNVRKDAYVSWDDSNLYVFLSIDGTQYTTNSHEGPSPDNTGNIWNMANMQVSVSKHGNIGGDRLEFGTARNSSTGENLWHCWAQSPDGSVEFELGDGDYAVVMDGNSLNYEVRIPFNTLLDFAPKADDKIGFMFMFNVADEDETRYWIEFASGCASGKDAERFATLTLTGNVLEAAPVVVAEPEVDASAAGGGEAADAAIDTPVARPAPSVRTGDTGMIALVVIMALAAAGVVIFRKKAVK